MKPKFKLFFCLLAFLSINGCDDTSADRELNTCDPVAKPQNAVDCECVDGVWINCTPASEVECKDADKPANSTECECIAGEWKNCNTSTETKECIEADKPEGATGCTCNTSTGEWENCNIPGDNKECAEEDKPEGATDCECNTSTGEWENCNIPGDNKECAEEDKPEGATDCECNTSTGEWENCNIPGDNKECIEADKPEGATDCQCNTSTGEWENCTTPRDNKECAEADKPEDATGCECNTSTGEWENCTENEKTCDEADKPAGSENCECIEGEWQNCIYPELTIYTNPQNFTVSESGEKSDIEIKLSTCPVMPTTITATTDNPEECAVYSKTEDKIVESFDLLFNGDNCGETLTVTVIGVDDRQDDDNVQCKLLLTASSEDSNANTSYDGMTVEVEGINEDNDTAKINFKVSKTTINETATDGSNDSNLHVVLATKPTSDVTIHFTTANVNASDTVEHLTLETNQLTFTPDNYQKPQYFKFTAVHDHIVMDAASVKITGTASSTDPKYDKMTQSTNIQVTNVDTIGLDIQTSGTTLYESKPTQSQPVTVKLKSKPTSSVEVKVASTNNRVKVSASNDISKAHPAVTYIMNSEQWDTGRTFYIFPNDDEVVNSNNTDKLEVTTYSIDSAYTGLKQEISTFTVVDDDTNGELKVSCTGTAGCTTQQGFATCTFTLSNRPADNSDVSVTCTSAKVWVNTPNKLTNANNYTASSGTVGSYKCGAAMEGDRYATTTISCTAENASKTFRAKGSTSLTYSYHHLEGP